jgi:arylsulfatase A-like enzyme
LEPGATVETTAATFEPSCEQALTLPLTVVWDKHVDTNRISDGLISSIDLLPTIVELTGGTPPSEIDGRSFAGLLRGESFEHRDIVYCALYEGEKLTKWTARDARFKFVSDDPSGTSGKLYDLLSDAEESNDLSQDPAFVNRSTELRDQLQLWIKRH